MVPSPLSSNRLSSELSSFFHVCSHAAIVPSRRAIMADGHAMTMTVHDKAVRELLAFYQEAGVDAAIGETPVDRLSEPNRATRRRRSRARRPSRAAAGQPRAVAPDLGARARNQRGRAPPSPEAAVMAAREAATTAADLDELRAILERFEGCALRATATQLVFARGNPQARVMFVGEAPGYEEDKSGLPFVGRSGQLLDRMMAAIGLDENSMPTSPTSCRGVRPATARRRRRNRRSACRSSRARSNSPNPDVLVCLGGPSAQTLLNIRDGITKSRGRWYPVPGRHAARSARSRPSTRRSCCAARCRSASPGAISWRSGKRWRVDLACLTRRSRTYGPVAECLHIIAMMNVETQPSPPDQLDRADLGRRGIAALVSLPDASVTAAPHDRERAGMRMLKPRIFRQLRAARSLMSNATSLACGRPDCRHGRRSEAPTRRSRCAVVVGPEDIRPFQHQE